MADWTEVEEHAARRLVELALEEDLGQPGDITSEALIAGDWQGTAWFVARQPGILCGQKVAERVLRCLESQAVFQWACSDGSLVTAGFVCGQVRAPLKKLLSAERTMLNFLQRLSGIATLTKHFVERLQGLRCVLLDTRKTAPGWRILEKYAVRCGGGHNHRRGLYDGILIKDNHLAALRERGVDLAEAIRQLRQRFGSRYPIEVEADTLDLVAQALRAGADIILLDNMPLEVMKEAVTLRDQLAPHVSLEASGGITLQNVRAVAETGVDRISVGAVTHSAPALDIALEYKPSPQI
ncbi:putative nicotinate-nucleotide pyrophosphorylase [carboxylating] [bacterium HR36]|nr:putative nicotinate-nucleotide pyrophosphorylase [carboxylating] [bacterium HR36]